MPSFDFEYAAAFVSAALGVLAALVAIFPPKGLMRAFVALVFILLGGASAWFVSHSLDDAHARERDASSKLAQIKSNVDAIAGIERAPYAEFVPSSSSDTLPVEVVVNNPRQQDFRDVAIAVFKTSGANELRVGADTIDLVTPGMNAADLFIGEGDFIVLILGSDFAVEEDATIVREGGALKKVFRVTYETDNSSRAWIEARMKAQLQPLFLTEVFDPYISCSGALSSVGVCRNYLEMRLTTIPQRK
jgi:hypothetical protein